MSTFLDEVSRLLGGINLDAKDEPRTDGWPTEYEIAQRARQHEREGKLTAAQAAHEIRGYLGIHS